MHAHVTEPFRTVVPTLRYRDVAAAIEWLCKAFAFDRHLIVPGEDGSVRYAELTHGRGMIMLGPIGGSAFDKLMTQPVDAGGAETQICYLYVDDPVSHRTRAEAAGAEIVLDLQEHSGRGYSCRDPEGHIWNFGTYDPWKRQSAVAEDGRAPAPRSATLRGILKRLTVVSGVFVCVVASAIVAEWASSASGRARREMGTAVMVRQADAAASVHEKLEQEHKAREIAERDMRIARNQVALERKAKEAAERLAREAQERSAREAAERAARDQVANGGAEQPSKEAREMREQLARKHSALEAAQQIARETREQLTFTERTAEELRNELAAERRAREELERANQQFRQQLEDEHLKEQEERNRQAREKAAKERAAREAAERAAKEAERVAREARERRQQGTRRVVVPSQPVAAGPVPTPFTGRSDN